MIEDPTTGAMFRITNITLSGSQASLAVTAIPARFARLAFFLDGRTDLAGTADSVVLSLNSDTTDANYDRQLTSASNASTAPAQAMATSGSRVIGAVTGATAPANHFGGISGIVRAYARTDRFKKVRAQSDYWTARTSGGGFIRDYGYQWCDTSAVTSLTFTPSAGTNWVAGTVLDVYGILAAG